MHGPGVETYESLAKAILIQGAILNYQLFKREIMLD